MNYYNLDTTYIQVPWHLYRLQYPWSWYPGIIHHFNGAMSCLVGHPLSSAVAPFGMKPSATAAGSARVWGTLFIEAIPEKTSQNTHQSESWPLPASIHSEAGGLASNGELWWCKGRGHGSALPDALGQRASWHGAHISFERERYQTPKTWNTWK